MFLLAGVAELVDALDSGSSVFYGCASSNLALGTIKINLNKQNFKI